MHANQIARIRQQIETGIRFGTIAGDAEKLTAHAVRIEEFFVHSGARLDWQRFPLTVTDEELQAAADAKTKANKRSAGARALSKKYGKETAERIIERKTGKHINLQR
jgi:hypothetical protein